MEKNLSNDSDVINFYSSWKTFLQARSSDYSLLNTYTIQFYILYEKKDQSIRIEKSSNRENILIRSLQNSPYKQK